jgi:hypothetical protein
MNKKDSEIFLAAVFAELGSFTAFHDIPISVFAAFPAGMVFSDDQILVPPDRKTGLIAEKQLTF